LVHYAAGRRGNKASAEVAWRASAKLVRAGELKAMSPGRFCCEDVTLKRLLAGGKMEADREIMGHARIRRWGKRESVG
jgi:hypothetical protein